MRYRWALCIVVSNLHPLSSLLLAAVFFGGCQRHNDMQPTGTVRLELIQATKNGDEEFTAEWRITNESDRKIRYVSLAVAFRDHDGFGLGLENVFAEELEPLESDVDSFMVSNVKLDDIADWEAHIQLVVDDETGELIQNQYGVEVSFVDQNVTQQ